MKPDMLLTLMIQPMRNPPAADWIALSGGGGENVPGRGGKFIEVD
jgi:hypothetical protein